ncbi:MAG: hypothetical protein KJ893_07755 [Candidatus Omnitrophica bacterium]|nr:hypothetical protein [Candidatus Omnitrophota bacterium]MBU4479073.1 hypothetical protein [Candidatus Omnitrophota bacterium]MCG2704160.1 hypothetical protein [Candidatus Omnitrophota bacterium]
MLEGIYKKEGRTNEMAGFYRDLKNNYNKIRYICAKNNISFIAMQYPVRERER